MSIRSTIGIEHHDGSIKCVYCYFDGYQAEIGKILLLNYDSGVKIEELMYGGDMCILRNVSRLVQSAQHPQPQECYTLHYRRNRGAKGTDVKVCTSRQEFVDVTAYNGSEGAFLFTKLGEWLYQKIIWQIKNEPDFMPLKQATIAHLQNLINNIPSFTWIPEELRVAYLIDYEADLNLIEEL